MKKILFALFIGLLPLIGWSSSLSPANSVASYGAGNPVPAPPNMANTPVMYFNADNESGANATTLLTLHDMTSNAFNASAATTTQAPTIVTNIWAGPQGQLHNAIRFDNTNVNTQMNLAGGMSVTENSYSVVFISREADHNNASWINFGTGWTLNYNFYSSQGAGSSSVQSVQNNTQTVNGHLALPQGIVLHAQCSGGASIVFRVNNDIENITNSSPASVLSGGTICSIHNLSAWGATADVFACLVYDHMLSDDEWSSLQQWAYANWGVRDSGANQNIICAGDSIVAGNAITGKTWPEYIFEHVPFWPRVYNFGITGLTLVNLISDISGPLNQINPNCQNVVVLEGGTNDLNGGTTAANTYTLACQYCAQIRNKGAYVIYCNILPRTGLGVTVANTNTLLSSAVSGLVALGCADQIVNVNGDARIALQGDGVHPTQAGVNYYGEDVCKAIRYGTTGLPAVHGGTITLASGAAAATNYFAYKMANPQVRISVNGNAGAVTGTTYVGIVAAGQTIINFNAYSAGAAAGSDASTLSYVVYDNKVTIN